MIKLLAVEVKVAEGVGLGVGGWRRDKARELLAVGDGDGMLDGAREVKGETVGLEVEEGEGGGVVLAAPDADDKSPS